MLSSDTYGQAGKSPGLMARQSNKRMSERKSANIFNKERASNLHKSHLMSSSKKDEDSILQYNGTDNKNDESITES